MRVVVIEVFSVGVIILSGCNDIMCSNLSLVGVCFCKFNMLVLGIWIEFCKVNLNGYFLY